MVRLFVGAGAGLPLGEYTTLAHGEGVPRHMRLETFSISTISGTMARGDRSRKKKSGPGPLFLIDAV
jgi:hypothetical protein